MKEHKNQIKERDEAWEAYMYALESSDDTEEIERLKKELESLSEGLDDPIYLSKNIIRELIEINETDDNINKTNNRILSDVGRIKFVLFGILLALIFIFFKL